MPLKLSRLSKHCPISMKLKGKNEKTFQTFGLQEGPIKFFCDEAAGKTNQHWLDGRVFDFFYWT